MNQQEYDKIAESLCARLEEAWPEIRWRVETYAERENALWSIAAMYPFLTECDPTESIMVFAKEDSWVQPTQISTELVQDAAYPLLDFFGRTIERFRVSKMEHPKG